MQQKLLETGVVKAGGKTGLYPKGEYGMAKLELLAGRRRKSSLPRVAKRWTEAQATALLGALSADATIESIAARTGHSVKAVNAKLARLNAPGRRQDSRVATSIRSDLLKVAGAQDPPLERATEKCDLGEHSGK